MGYYRTRLAIAALAALAAVPFTVQAHEHDTVEARLRDPWNQAVAAGAVRAAGEVLLDVRLRPVIEALRRTGFPQTQALDPGMTLRDLAGPGGRELPRKAAHAVPVLMDAAGTLAGKVESATGGAGD